MVSEASLNELRIAIQEASKPIVIQLVNVEKKIDNVADIVRPIPAQIVRLETQVDGLNDDKTMHEMKITGLTGKMQNIELTLAHAAPPSISFWEGTNGKYIIILAITIISTLAALAGYKIK